MNPRRAYGTGSVHQRPDGKWVASMKPAGPHAAPDGARPASALLSRPPNAPCGTSCAKQTSTRRPARAARPTVRTWSEVWLETRATQLRPTTWQADRSQVNTWVIPTIGHKRLDQLTPGDRRALARTMEHSGASTASITRADAVLGKLLRDAIIEGHRVPQAILLVRSSNEVESDRDAIPLPDAPSPSSRPPPPCPTRPGGSPRSYRAPETPARACAKQ